MYIETNGEGRTFPRPSYHLATLASLDERLSFKETFFWWCLLAGCKKSWVPGVVQLMHAGLSSFYLETSFPWELADPRFDPTNSRNICLVTFSNCRKLPKYFCNRRSQRDLAWALKLRHPVCGIFEKHLSEDRGIWNPQPPESKLLTKVPCMDSCTEGFRVPWLVALCINLGRK